MSIPASALVLTSATIVELNDLIGFYRETTPMDVREAVMDELHTRAFNLMSADLQYAAEDSTVDVYEYAEHTMDDGASEGIEIRCFASRQEISYGETDYCAGTAECRRCGQTVKAEYLGEFPA